MAKSNRLRLGDLRAIYLLVGECLELGADAVAWKTHLLKSLMTTFHADVGQAVEMNRDLTRAACFIDAGWGGERDSKSFRWLMREQMDRNPSLPVVRARAKPLQAFTRRDILSDDCWYGNEFCSEYMRLTNLDDWVGLYYVQDPDHGFSVGLNRERGSRRFEPRERLLLRLFGTEIAPKHGVRLAMGMVPSVIWPPLAPRMRQVLICLCEGDSEKQAALRLEISSATIHEYIRRLYRRFEVNSRGELLAQCIPLLPVLREQ